MRPKLRDGLVAGALVLSILGVIGAVLWPVFAPAPELDHPMHDTTQLKMLALGTLMYASDWDECAPPALGWFDLVNEVYIRYEQVGVCVGLDNAGQGQFGHALHRAIMGARIDTLEHPERTVLVFDSTDLSRNAVSRLSQLPNPGRNDGKNAIAYADGHARFVGVGEPP